MSLVDHLAGIALADPDPAPAHPVFVAAHPSALALDPAPIEPSWILAGSPQARAKIHSQSADGFSSTTIWECDAGAFRWRFEWDETVHILSGSVKVTDETGRVTEIRAGDVAYFAAGSWATWEIDDHVRKIAFCRRAFPKPVAAALKLRSALAALVKGAGAAPAGTGLQGGGGRITAQGS